MEDIVRHGEGRRGERPRSGRRAAKEAARDTEAPPAQTGGANVVSLGVSRLTTLVSSRLPGRNPEPDTSPASVELPKLRVPLPQAGDAKSWAIRISFMACVALPTFLAILYYGFIAADQYVSEFRFSVRPGEARMASSASTAAPSSGSFSSVMAMIDNFIVVDFVRSRQAVDTLERDIGLKKVFASEEADYFARLGEDVSAERLVEYWESMVESAFDLTSGIAMVRVRAFTPEESHRVATRLMQLSEALINDVNARSRRDAIRFAEDDLRRAEERLKDARVAIREFRTNTRTPDPIKDAEAVFTLATKMREEIARLNTELSRALGSMAPSAPTVLVLKDKLKATEDQLKLVESRFGESTAGVRELLPVQLAQYEELEVERMFAEKLYASVLTTLESARSSANMQHTYVAAFVEPALPEKALYPQRILSIFIVTIVCVALWISGLLLVYAIRDHAFK